ncbi:hypothetical protein QTO34_010035 [Cnephaeus nilssonii]|uniref:Uncharacterized protein n=1 Tax=Cnephaeus nilssonii TaxID=3371016 RepID=A0AA40LF42_CNENI|nr:hypothetical protein QTO34_010035 [Eptesicus nilssonii]
MWKSFCMKGSAHCTSENTYKGETLCLRNLRNTLSARKMLVRCQISLNIKKFTQRQYECGEGIFSITFDFYKFQKTYQEKNLLNAVNIGKLFATNLASYFIRERHYSAVSFITSFPSLG